jgi:hypothetical protein
VGNGKVETPMTSLTEIIGELIEGAVAAAGAVGGGSVTGVALVGGAAAAGGAVSRYLRRRLEAARDILLDELRHAGTTSAEAASEDETIAVCYRYSRAALEGTARLNLRLLAKVIAGKAAARNLVADEFLQHAEALATLSRDEIIVIGTMYGAWAEQTKQAREHPATFPQGINPWAAAKRDLAQAGWNEGRTGTAATRSQRSGLLVAKSGWGAMVFEVSPLLIDLGKTVDFTDALQREAKS